MLSAHAPSSTPETEVSLLEEECAELKRKLEETEKLTKALESQSEDKLSNLNEEKKKSLESIGTQLSDQIKDGEALKFEMDW